MIKDVLVELSRTLKGAYPAADYAISLGSAFESHLTGVAFAYEPVVSPDIVAGMPAAFIEQLRAENVKLAREAVARFTAAAAKAGVSADAKVVDATLAGAGEMFGRMARTFDIAVARQAEPEEAFPGQFIVESALFDSGRPIIVVPYIHREPLKLDRVMVCWDGSRTAARARGDAEPLLLRAKFVDVVIVKDKDGPDETPTAAEVAAHLARHGLKTHVERIVAPDSDVPDMLLSYAADSSADLMVMGGYGHSRLREFILGGATRGILQSMTVPVLMSH
jgi:nucleotide-binding universal stress UspA family protein